MHGTILLIDDNTLVTEIYRKALLQRGYQVLEGTNISQGRHYFENHHPDLIIMETVLPDGDGNNFCRELRNKSSVPIIIVTIRGKDEDIISGHDAGADLVFPKPYSTEMLIVRMEGLLRRVRRSY